MSGARRANSGRQICKDLRARETKKDNPMDALIWTFYTIFLFVLLSLVLGSFFTVSTAQVAVITRFGKFIRAAEPGLNWKWPIIDTVAGKVSLRVNQINLTMETKTRDNVFVTIPISVQNKVRPDKVFDAFYKLSNPVEQIQSYVEQVILGHVPGMTLDEVFASQSGIAAAVKQELDADMAAFGYEIVNVLVTDIVPDAKVKSAMNDINAAQREQVAAAARGEAEKILVVKKAEAEAESKALQGQGIANQRKAIIEGLRGSIEQFQKSIGGASTSEVMQLVLVTQYFDTIKSIGELDKTNTLFLSHSPGAVRDISDQIMQSMLVAERAKS
jgi:regulator of protease activity HflC (stomatin/prohibitin superfamily)